ncbi:hypothetical protein LZ30DRAFT_731909 [Colletotrichum cereale]|nr:hypothetical protein LZ30DRAFT_731909 [Colletotrichum cereale]
MFPQIRTCRRKSTLSALILFFFLAAAAAAATADALDEAASNATLQDLSHLYLVPDASCAGHEGQWNCLSDRFQHCVDGQWSAVLSCSGAAENAVDAGAGATGAAVSLCSPLGRTDLVDFEGECGAAWAWGGGGGGWGGGGTSCNGNRCYYGAGARLGAAGPWAYVSVVGALVVGFW